MSAWCSRSLLQQIAVVHCTPRGGVRAVLLLFLCTAAANDSIASTSSEHTSCNIIVFCLPAAEVQLCGPVRQSGPSSCSKPWISESTFVMRLTWQRGAKGNGDALRYCSSSLDCRRCRRRTAERICQHLSQAALPDGGHVCNAHSNAGGVCVAASRYSSCGQAADTTREVRIAIVHGQYATAQ